MHAPFAWATLLVLGAVHGLNPGMGWLFAVSLGLQEGSDRAVWRSLGPLAVGHAAAVSATLLVAALLGTVLPLAQLKWIAVAVLLGFGVFHLLGHGHVGRAGMRVGSKDLAIWSFFMSSAHGAGVMALPSVLLLAAAGGAGAGHPAAGHAAHLALDGHAHAQGVTLLATGVHTAGYLTVAGGVAWLVYSRLGLRILRSCWINLDLIWAGALVVTAAATALL